MWWDREKKNMDKYNSAKYGGSSNKYAQSARAEAEQKHKQQKQAKEPGFWRPTPTNNIGIPAVSKHITMVFRTPPNTPGASKSTEEALSKPPPEGVKRVIQIKAQTNYLNVDRPPSERRSMSPPEDLNHKYYARPYHNFSPIMIPQNESQHMRLDREGRVYFPPGSTYRYDDLCHKRDKINSIVNRVRNRDNGYCSDG